STASAAGYLSAGFLRSSLRATAASVTPQPEVDRISRVSTEDDDEGITVGWFAFPIRLPAELRLPLPSLAGSKHKGDLTSRQPDSKEAGECRPRRCRDARGPVYPGNQNSIGWGLV